MSLINLVHNGPGAAVRFRNRTDPVFGRSPAADRLGGVVAERSGLELAANMVDDAENLSASH